MSEHKNSVYRNIAKELCERIRSGEYVIGQKLPPERTLMLEFDVERTTIRRALELLSADGYILKRTGLGSFVCSPEEAMRTKQDEEQVEKRGSASENFKSVSFGVYEDVIGGAEKLASVLSEHGHERIAYIGGNAACFGALAAALCAKEMYQPAYFIYERDVRRITSAFERFWRQLRMPAPTAIVCTNTLEAQTIERCLERLRLRVPHDVTLAVLHGKMGDRYGGCVYELTTTPLFTHRNNIGSLPTVIAPAVIQTGETIGAKRPVREKNISDFLL